MITFNPEIIVTPQVGNPIKIKVLDYSVTYDNIKNVATALLTASRCCVRTSNVALNAGPTEFLNASASAAPKSARIASANSIIDLVWY